MSEQKESIQKPLASGLIKYAIVIIALAACTWLLEKMSGVLIPFVFAIFLYYNILPVMNFVQKRWKVSHFISVLISLAAYVIAYAVLALMIASSVKGALRSADMYQERILLFNDQVVAGLSEYGIEVSPDQLREGLKNSQVFMWLSNLSGGVVGLLGSLGLVLIFLLFILSSPVHHKRPLMDRVQTQLTRYIIAKSLSSLATGLLVGVALAILGVDMASLFGVLSFLLNFIPNIGSIVALLLPAPVVLLQSGFGSQFVLAMLIPGAIQFIIGSFVEPKLIGQTLNLHPITILLSLMYWGLVWGITGMFLAVPITAVMKIVFDQFSSTKPVANLMAGKF